MWFLNTKFTEIFYKTQNRDGFSLLSAVFRCKQKKLRKKLVSLILKTVGIFLVAFSHLLRQRNKGIKHMHACFFLVLGLHEGRGASAILSALAGGVK